MNTDAIKKCIFDSDFGIQIRIVNYDLINIKKISLKDKSVPDILICTKLLFLLAFLIIICI